MPLALSGGNNVWGQFSATSAVAWIDGMNYFLRQAGWEDNGPLAGGYLLKATSPQGHEVEAKIYSVLDGGLIHTRGAIQFRNTSDSTIHSGIKYFYAGAGRTARIIANRCQFFVYIPGATHDELGNVICGGCGFTAGTAVCHGAQVNETVTEAWWLMGDGRTGESSVIHNTPRTTLLGYGQPDVTLGEAGDLDNSDGCINGVVKLGGVRFNAMTPVTAFLAKFTSHTLWVGDQALNLEPLIAWPTPTETDPVLVRMQAYDARVHTQPHAMDTTVTEDGHTWLRFSNSYYFGCLELILPDEFERFPSHFTH